MGSRASRPVRGRSRKFYAGLAVALIEWAEEEFRSNRRAADGATEREHLVSGRAQWENIPAAFRPASRRDRPVRLPVVIDGPEFPYRLDYIWAWFQEISLGLSSNGFGPPTVTWEALRSWQAMTGAGPLEPWEARLLVQLGILRASIQSETRREAEQHRPPQPAMTVPRRAIPPPPRR